jgi:ABC-type lipopolysaccharide export system ATPase subunit
MNKYLVIDALVTAMRKQKVDMMFKVVFGMLRDQGKIILDDKQLFELINNEDASMQIAYKIIEQLAFLD